VNSSQTLAASYRYDPFGNTISSSGSLASANVYRFSSKEIHVNSGMYYYWTVKRSQLRDERQAANLSFAWARFRANPIHCSVSRRNLL